MQDSFLESLILLEWNDIIFTGLKLFYFQNIILRYVLTSCYSQLWLILLDCRNSHCEYMDSLLELYSYLCHPTLDHQDIHSQRHSEFCTVRTIKKICLEAFPCWKSPALINRSWLIRFQLGINSLYLHIPYLESDSSSGILLPPHLQWHCHSRHKPWEAHRLKERRAMRNGTPTIHLYLCVSKNKMETLLCELYVL